MAQTFAPTQISDKRPVIDVKTGLLTPYGFYTLHQMWRQVAAGFVIVPATITGTNLLTLTVDLAAEGAASYGKGMAWFGAAANNSTGAVTAFVTDGANPLATVKVFKTDGAAQAGAGDLVAGSSYLFLYDPALDSAAGGLVLK